MSDYTKDEIVKCGVNGCDWEDARYLLRQHRAVHEQECKNCDQLRADLQIALERHAFDIGIKDGIALQLQRIIKDENAKAKKLRATIRKLRNRVKELEPKRAEIKPCKGCRACGTSH